MNAELPSQSPDSAADHAATPADTDVKRATPSGLALSPSTLWLLVGLLAVAALLTVILLWQKVSGMQEQLARQSAEAQAQSLEARALAKQAVSLAQESATRVTVQEARLSEVALQRSQLDELMQSLSRSRDENLVVDVEAALRLAQQQAQLTGSVEPLLAALKSADKRIARAAQPRLALLQRALARDIERISSSAFSDTPSLLIKLDELVRMADDLDVSNAMLAAPADPSRRHAAAVPAPNWWQSAWQLMRDEARSLVRVSRITTPEAALVSPQQAFFLRENLKLKLLNARLGLLARQTETARADLAAVESLLKKYFDENARKTQSAITLLSQVQSQMRNLQLPRIDETLALLATTAAGR